MARSMKRSSASRRRSYRRSSKRSKCRGTDAVECNAKPTCTYVKTRKRHFCRRSKNRRHRKR